MKNKLTDLNNHLFEEMERLNDESLKGDKLNEEMERAKTMSLVASQIISNANLVLKANQTQHEGIRLPEIMSGEKENQPMKLTYIEK